MSNLTNKAKTKKCRTCKNEFTPFRSTAVVCSWECASKEAAKQQEEKEKKEQKAFKEKLRESTKTLGQYEADAKKAIQKWIRMRDKDQPCISCGTYTAELFDGGHYFKAELFSGLIFDERNIHKQCRQCNFRLNGNEIQYRIGLVKRYGEDFVKQLEEDSNKKRDHKYTKNELIAKKLQYEIKIKELKK